DGLTATRAIRKKEAQTGGHLPIIALTAHARDEDSERCLSAGMDAFVTKPLKAQELIDVLARLGATRKPVADNCSASKQPVEAMADLDIVLNQLDGDKDLLRAMGELFCKQSVPLLSEIRE